MLLTVTVIELVCPPSIAFTFTSSVAFQLNVFVKIVCVVLTVPYVTGYDSLYDTFHPLALAWFNCTLSSEVIVTVTFPVVVLFGLTE